MAGIITHDPQSAAFVSLRPAARFTVGLDHVERVEVLPFQQTGTFEWQRLGLNSALEAVESPALVAQICEIFRAEGLKAD
ncbi:MAG: hypothetical protein ACJ731_01910 [Vicinamibacterales bacterium]